MGHSPETSIITLTTDFGLADHYAGTMKGVLLTRCPTAQIVDISHEIPPFSIPSGAYTVSQAAPYFPAGTIHVVVVDPGSGEGAVFYRAGQRGTHSGHGGRSPCGDPGDHQSRSMAAVAFPNVSRPRHFRPGCRRACQWSG